MMRPLLVLLLVALAGCATDARRPLRVLVYNIHAGKDASGIDNLERVGALVRSTRADLVLLQEVDRNTERSGDVDQLATLQQLTGLHGVFGKALDYQGGLYGIAILSRWPITAHDTVPLHLTPQSVEARVALFADVAMPGGTVTIVNTHLDHHPDDTWRRQEVARLLQAIAARERRPLLIGGDFNSTPDSDVQATLRNAGLKDAWTMCGRGDELTYPAGTPLRRIDYLFLTGAARCTEARVIDTDASDHRPVLVDVAR